jgi:hypothetical protein
MIDIMLVTVTGLSLTIASVMGVITWRALRQERRRFDARVADLSAAADAVALAEEAEPVLPVREPAARGAAEEVHAAAAPDDPAGPLWTDLVDVPRSARRPADAALLAGPDLFTAQEPMRSNGRRLMLAVGLGSAFLLVAFAAVLALNPRPARPATLSPAAARVSAPLELVVLDHARAGARLSIHGLVRNPPTGTVVRQLQAVVFLFDRDGAYLGTAQAPVVDVDLAPGRESAFDVPIEHGQRVARYRLTFRVAAAPVPHVDRRAVVPPSRPATTRAAIVARADDDGPSTAGQ